MKARLTPEELQRHHDGLCGVAIGDGDCSCLVHWVEGLQKDLDAKELQVDELRKGMFDIVGFLQGGLPDAASFQAVYEIANGFIEKRDKPVPKEEPRFWNCCGKLVVPGDSAHPYGCQQKKKV